MSSISNQPESGVVIDPKYRYTDIASLFIVAILLSLIVTLHLLPALFAGMLAYLMIHSIAALTSSRLSGHRSKILGAFVVTLVVLGVLGAATVGLIAFVRSETGIAALLEKMALILEDARSYIPASAATHLPADAEALRVTIIDWLKTHSAEMQTVGKEAGVFIAHVLIGSIIGAMAAFREAAVVAEMKPLAATLSIRVARFGLAFKQIVGAQAKISAINTVLTALYLLVALPLFGVHLPFVKTLILITFLVGLLPVVGNLLSNTFIIIVSLSHSSGAAVCSLAFLVLVHKAEYFLNAKIIGSEIEAQPWELLLAMLLMESIFGMAGVAAAPIFYAYLKTEARAYQLL